MDHYVSDKHAFKPKGFGENGKQEGGNMLERGIANDVTNLMDMHKEGGRVGWGREMEA